MELRISVRDHVRDVQVADPTVGRFSHGAATALDVLPVTQLRLVPQGSYDDPPRLAPAAVTDGQLDVESGLVDQLLRRRTVASDGVAVDGEDRVAITHLDAGRLERRAVAGRPVVGTDNALHLPAAAAVQPQVGAQEPETVLRHRAVVTAAFVGVRRAELALQLPDQVGELRPRAETFHQRLVAVVDALPVDAGHVRIPEEVALQTPRLAEHLSPLRARVDFDARAAEVEPAAGTARLVGVTARFVGLRRLAAGLDRPQPVARAVDESGAVQRDPELVDTTGERALLTGRDLDL